MTAEVSIIIPIKELTDIRRKLYDDFVQETFGSDIEEGQKEGYLIEEKADINDVWVEHGKLNFSVSIGDISIYLAIPIEKVLTPQKIQEIKKHLTEQIQQTKNVKEALDTLSP